MRMVVVEVSAGCFCGENVGRSGKAAQSRSHLSYENGPGRTPTWEEQNSLEKKKQIVARILHEQQEGNISKIPLFEVLHAC